MEPIRIIFETKEMAKDDDEDEKKSQDDSTQIKMIEEDEPTQKIEKIKDEEPSIIIIRFVDPPFLSSGNHDVLQYATVPVQIPHC